MAITHYTLLGALVVTFATLLCPMYWHIIIIIILLLLLFSTRFASIKKRDILKTSNLLLRTTSMELGCSRLSVSISNNWMVAAATCWRLDASITNCKNTQKNSGIMMIQLQLYNNITNQIQTPNNKLSHNRLYWLSTVQTRSRSSSNSSRADTVNDT